MLFHLLDRLGNWNPQLLRELKGRLKFRNVLLTLGTSLLGQVLVFMHWWNQIFAPYSLSKDFCKLLQYYNSEYLSLKWKYSQLQDDFFRYSGPQEYNPEKIQQLKETIDSIKLKILDLKAILPDNEICPTNAIDWTIWWRHLLENLSIIAIFFC